MAGTAVIDGNLDFAFLILLAFDAYLRPCDVLRLRRHFFIPPQRCSGGTHQWTLVPHPAEGRIPSKSNSFDDSILVGHGRRGWLNQTTSLFLRRVSGSGLLFPLSEGKVRSLISQYSDKLRLGPLALSFHGLRHGGPSTDFLEGSLSLESIQRRGRWKSLSSVRRYEKHGLVAAQMERLSAQQKRDASLVSAGLPGLLARALGRGC